MQVDLVEGPGPTSMAGPFFTISRSDTVLTYALLVTR